MLCSSVVVFFFKQKTAYEMRISDWSSDVCSSDLGRMCAENDAVRAKAKEIGLENIDGQIKHAESLGLHFSQGDMEALAKEVQGEGELSEEDQNGRASCREGVCQYV